MTCTGRLTFLDNCQAFDCLGCVTSVILLLSSGSGFILFRLILFLGCMLKGKLLDSSEVGLRPSHRREGNNK